MIIAFWSLAGLVALCGAISTWAGWRRARQLAACRAAPDAAPPAEETLSIIVPARNEAHNLPALLASLAHLTPPPHQVIVVDDGSSDGTGELARAAGVTVISPPPLPPGWIGKSWACHAGAAHATGQWLLFTDADTVHAPWSTRAALAAASARGAALLSVVPTHAVVRAWEALQGAFFALLLLACNAGAPRAARHPGERRFSIGQYLLFRADAYRALGGHERVRDRLAEDLALAEAVVAEGGRFELAYAPGLLGVRMYPEGVRAFVRGWRRSFREGMRAAGGGGAFELVAVIGWLGGVPLLAGAVLASLAGLLPPLPSAIAAAVAGAYLLTAAVLAHASRELGAFPRWTALLYPLPVAAFVLVSALAALDALRGAPVAWRGRQIQLGPSSSRIR